MSQKDIIKPSELTKEVKMFMWTIISAQSIAVSLQLGSQGHLCKLVRVANTWSWTYGGTTNYNDQYDISKYYDN